MSVKMKPLLGVLLVFLCCFCSGALSKSLSYGEAVKTLVRREADAKNSSLGASGQCQKPIDLVFVMDSSESVGAENWMKIVNFTKKLCGKFDVKYARVGVIQYHSTAEVPITLSSFPDNVTLANTIEKIYYKAGSTRTDLAASKILDVFNGASHRNATRLAIFILSGRSTEVYVSQGKSIKAEQLLLKPGIDLANKGIAVYAVAVKNGLKDDDVTIQKKEIDMLVSTPPQNHRIDVDAFDDLDGKVEDVAKKTCIVNGGWGEWSDWSTCSVTCGGGTQLHMRECNSPTPANDGLPCQGPVVEQQYCNMQPCGDNENNGKPSTPSTSGNATSPSSNVTSPNANSTSPNSSATGETPPTLAPANTTSATNTNATSPATTPAPTKTTTTARPVYTTPPTHPPRPTPSGSPNDTVTYGNLDYTQCGNGFELITVSPYQLSASSVYTRDTDDRYIFANHEPSNGVLFNTQRAGAWCAEHRFATANDRNQYLQFDLLTPTLIGKIATQGMHRFANWVTTYQIKYSIDAQQWFTFPLTLRGNVDQETVVENFVNPAIHARFVQILPQTWNTNVGSGKNDICIRVGLYRCRACDLVPIARCFSNIGRGQKYITKKSKIEEVSSITQTRSDNHEHKKIEKKHKGHREGR